MYFLLQITVSQPPVKSNSGAHVEQCFNQGMRAWPHSLRPLREDSLQGAVAEQAGYDGLAQASE